MFESCPARTGCLVASRQTSPDAGHQYSTFQRKGRDTHAKIPYTQKRGFIDNRSESIEILPRFVALSGVTVLRKLEQEVKELRDGFRRLECQAQLPATQGVPSVVDCAHVRL